MRVRSALLWLGASLSLWHLSPGQWAVAASAEPTKASLTPTRVTRPVAGGPIVLPRSSCGTHWTAWGKAANADVNPCPKGCERGRRLQLNEHKSAGATEYQANYECYLPQLEVPQPAQRARAAGAPPRQNCGTMWTGWQSDPNSAVNPCPANCERGELRLVNRSLSNGKPAFDMNYQCYAKESTAGSANAGGRQQVHAAAIVMRGRWPMPRATAVAAALTRMRGGWPVQAAAGTVFGAATIRMPGRWPLATDATAVATGAIRVTGRGPVATAEAVVASEPIRMTGRWPVSAGPTKLKTGAIRMTGRSPR